MFNTMQQALKKQIITVFEPMYLDILNDDMVGVSNITAREMLDHLFLTYGNTTAVDLGLIIENLYRREACVYFADSGHQEPQNKEK
jgi:hypothetical protein